MVMPQNVMLGREEMKGDDVRRLYGPMEREWRGGNGDEGIVRKGQST